MKPVNINAFRKLVKRYETITIEEIKPIRKRIKNTLYIGGATTNKLTGFGNTSTCSLCIITKKKNEEEHYEFNCSKCVYKDTTEEEGCHRDINYETYFQICIANTSRKLLAALRARAKHLRKEYPQYL